MTSAPVFISYSSQDRELVLAIELQLRSHGVVTWLDRHQISGGATWTAELVKAISTSSVVLLMASGNAFASANVQREIALAGDKGKTIIPLILERGLKIPAAFEYWLVEKHRLDAFQSTEVWFPSLLAALTALLSDSIKDGAVAAVATDTGPNPGRTPPPRQLFVQNLADRSAQERQILVELEQHMTLRPRRPIIVIAHGERSQCLDGFVDRLEKHTFPQHLKRLQLSDQLDWQHVQWPEPARNPSEDSAATRAGGYKVDVNLALGLGASADSQALAKSITNLRRPVAFCSLLDSKDWEAAELPLLKNVLKFWSSVPDTNRAQVVVICLAIVLNSTPTSLLNRWLRRDQQKSTVGATLRPLIPEHQNVGLVVLPELVDVPQADLAHWVRHFLRPDDPEEALQQLRRKLETIGVAPHDSLPMERLIPILRAMISPQT